MRPTRKLKKEFQSNRQTQISGLSSLDKASAERSGKSESDIREKTLKLAQTIVDSKDPLSARMRLLIAQAFITVEPKACDFNFARKYKAIPKDSASDSSIMFGVLANAPQPISIKATFQYDPKKDNSLAIERANYKIIGNHIIERHYSPNVIGYIGSFQCTVDSFLKSSLGEDEKKHIIRDLITAEQEWMLIEKFTFEVTRKKGVALDEDKIKQKARSEIEKFVEKVVDRLEPLHKYLSKRKIKTTNTKDILDFLVTEKAHNATKLYKWLKEPRSYQEYRSVFFQILYTFEVFNRLGFSHNDAHIGNIFIEDWSDVADVAETTVYNVDGKLYEIPTKRCFVKIYDFDKSALHCSIVEDEELKQRYETETQFITEPGHRCENNVLTDNSCRKFGQCQQHCSVYDPFTTFYQIGAWLSGNKEAGAIGKSFVDWISKKIVAKMPQNFLLKFGNQVYPDCTMLREAYEQQYGNPLTEDVFNQKMFCPTELLHRLGQSTPSLPLANSASQLTYTLPNRRKEVKACPVPKPEFIGGDEKLWDIRVATTATNSVKDESASSVTDNEDEEQTGYIAKVSNWVTSWFY